MNALKGKVAVVTGASKGIGAGIAKALASAGASVVVNYASSKEGAERVVGEITQNGGKAIAVQGDVSKEADVQRLFAETNKAYGSLDVLVSGETGLIIDIRRDDPLSPRTVLDTEDELAVDAAETAPAPRRA